MNKKLTNEEFIKKLRALNNRIIALDQYIDAKTKIRFQCKHGHIWYAKPSNILSGYGCPYCVGRYKTKETIQQELDKMGVGITIVGDCTGATVETDFMCKKEHIWRSAPRTVLAGRGCPYCANKKVLIGYNDLWTTNPHVAKLLKNPNDGYKYTYGSGKKVDFVCPDCGYVLSRDIHIVYQQGLICHRCSDGISYPNKFSRALLRLLPIDNIKHEWQPDWLKPYFYDNYFTYDNQEYVLEMDGGLGHGNRSLIESVDARGLRNDKIKDLLASQHNIVVIRIDCNYPRECRFEYIKNNILCSELNRLFNLTDINWRWCDEQAVRKMVKEVAELYNHGFAVKTICQKVGHSFSSVSRWLRQARSIGLCNYNTSESRLRGGKTITRHNVAVNQYTMDGIYVTTHVSMAEAKRALGLSGSNISMCCANPNRSTGGYKWYKATDLNQPDKTKILINSTQQND